MALRPPLLITFLQETNIMNKMKNGFTLVELIIVIAVIGVLAVVLMMAINPIEQINKAKDTTKKQLLFMFLTDIFPTMKSHIFLVLPMFVFCRINLLPRIL